MESKERTPSVIARLMGLDKLPPQQPVQKQQRVLSEYYLQRVASIGVREKRSSHERPSFRMSIEEQKEFDYIYRVLETLNRYKHHNLAVEEGKSSSSSSEENMAFMRNKFLDAKHISVEKKLPNVKELHVAMDIIDSKKDLLPKYIQEPDFFFTKHFHDQQGVPLNSQSGHATVLNSSRTSDRRNIGKCRKLGRTTEQENVKLLQKTENGPVKNPNGKLDLDNICKFPRSQLESKRKACHPRTKIVILKPKLANAEDGARCFSSLSSYEGSHSGERKLKEFPSPEKINFDVEVKERKDLAYDMKPTRQGFRVSREISGEVTKQTRHGIISISTKVSRSGLRVDDIFAKESELMMSPSTFSDSKDQYKSSLSFSHQSYVAREAKKLISKRWEWNKKFHKDELADRGSTLGELFAMPAHETRKRGVDYKPDKHGLSNQTGLNDGDVNSGSLLGISNRDGLKDGSVRNLPRSKFLSASSAVIGSPRTRIRYEGHHSGWDLSLEESVNSAQHNPRKQNFIQKDASELKSKKSQSFPCFDLESNQTVEEMCALHDEVKSKLVEKDPSDKNFMGPQSSSYSVLVNNHIVQDTLVVEDKLNNKVEESNMSERNIVLPKPSCSVASVSMATDVKADAETKVMGTPSKNSKEEQLEPTVCFTEKDYDSSNHASDTLIQQETSVGFHEEGFIFSHCSGMEQEPMMSLEVAYHPSPLSVLEPPFKDELSYSSECFEGGSTDICDSSESHSEGSGMIVSSDEDSGEGSVDNSKEDEDLMRLFRVEESRDFSYLIDVFTEAGFHGRILDMGFGTWYSPECPISLSIFETLEKKFGEQVSWMRSERRLLFDRINSGLVEILQSCMGMPTWAKPVSRRCYPRPSQEMIEEELWMLLVCQEQKVSKDSTEKMLGKELGLLDLGDDVDIIGREIERLLIDELAAEFVSMFNF